MKCGRRVTGNPGSAPPDIRLLLDESLTPRVAGALRLVGYDVQDVRTVFDPGGTRRAESVKDPEIIEWCRSVGAVWIHADDRARKEHRALLLRSGIRTLWIQRPGGRMAAREQLRILAFVLPKLLDSFANRPGARHYKATAANPLATPRLSRLRM